MASSIEKRVTAGGEIRYRAVIRLFSGKTVIHRESKTFGKRANAVKWLKRRESDLEQQHHLQGYGDHKKMLLSSLIDRYITEMSAMRPFGRSKHSALEMLSKSDIASQRVLEVRAADLVEHVRNRRLSGAGASTAQQDMVWLRVVFKYARRAWGVPVNVQAVEDAAATLRETKLIARPRRRKRRPTADELKRLTEYFACRRSSYPMDLIIWAAIYSTRRRDELLRILRSDVDLKGGVCLVRDVKHPDGAAGNHRTWEITDRLAPLLKHILAVVPADESGRLLPFHGKTVSAYFIRACKMLGIEDLHFHDLRHEGISRLAEDGLTIPQLAAISLHESWSSLSIYVNLQAGKRPPRYEWPGPE